MSSVYFKNAFCLLMEFPYEVVTERKSMFADIMHSFRNKKFLKCRRHQMRWLLSGKHAAIPGIKSYLSTLLPRLQGRMCKRAQTREDTESSGISGGGHFPPARLSATRHQVA